MVDAFLPLAGAKARQTITIAAGGIHNKAVHIHREVLPITVVGVTATAATPTTARVLLANRTRLSVVPVVAVQLVLEEEHERVHLQVQVLAADQEVGIN